MAESYNSIIAGLKHLTLLQYDSTTGVFSMKQHFYRTPLDDFKDTHRENTPSHKAEALTKSMNM